MTKETYGDTLKEIRVSRSLSQKGLTDGKLSRSLVAKIENNEVIPTINKFQTILQQLNLSFDEFFYIHQNYQITEFQDLSNQLFSRVTNADATSLNQLIAEYDDYLAKHDHPHIRDLKLATLAILEVHKNNFKKASRIVAPIWERVSKIETWTISDLKLINLILFTFPIDSAIHIGQSSLIQLEKYRGFFPNQHLSLSIKINLTGLLLKGQKFTQSTLNLINEVLQETEKLGIYEYYTVALFRKSIFLSAKNPKKVPKEREKAIQILTLLEKEHTLNVMLEEEKLYKESLAIDKISFES